MRPRFLADNDLREPIVEGLLRREPTGTFLRCRDVSLRERPDDDVLQYALDRRMIVVSHDVNTMPAAAYRRIEAGRGIAGLLLVKQSHPVSIVIENLVLILNSSNTEEWRNVVAFLPL